MSSLIRVDVLRSIAFLGIAAVHLELQDAPTIIAENIAAAIYADATTAQQWLGKDIVQKLLQASPIPLPSSPRPTSPTHPFPVYPPETIKEIIDEQLKRASPRKREIEEIMS